MDHHSTLIGADSAPANPAVSGAAAIRTPGLTISTQIAAANARLADLTQKQNAEAAAPRFPYEDSGRSLAEMAQADLDAALQLLAERALYITGASGGAIALRRDGHNHMLCRASAGENAPELGSLLSTEYGLSGESVRTRQPLRCDDTARDPRVNRDACRDLGISSVVIMPIASEEKILGVFELFSGQPNAFGERDLAALLRLSQMVEIAVRHAGAATIQSLAVAETSAPPSSLPSQAAPSEKIKTVSSSDAGDTLEKSFPPPSAKPLFWSAAARPQASAKVAPSENSNAVPPALRNLQQCQACGFPVSQGRTLCVECEEKKWRGQRVSRAGAAQVSAQSATPQLVAPQPASLAENPKFTAGSKASADVSAALELQPPNETASLSAPKASASPLSSVPSHRPSEGRTAPMNAPSEAAATPELSTSFLSSALPAESWFSSNKYILLALLIVAAVIAAVVGTAGWLR